MKRTHADDAFYNLPELEAPEFAPSYSRGTGIEDPNDLGDIGDSFSIGLDISDAEDSFALDE